MKVAIVVLAAGAATRMQRIKQLLPYKNSSLLDHAIHSAKCSNASDIICVLGANAVKIQKGIKIETISITINENWASGLGSSIVHGVNYVEKHFPEIEGILFTLADQPFVTTKYLNLILDIAVDAEKIYASYYHDTFGVPVLFPKKYFEDLKKLEGEQGAKKLLQIHQHQVIPVVPDFINLDIDTQEDYEKIIR